MSDRQIVNVLDKGFIELVSRMGDDAMVVNAARVSFAKHIDKLGQKDEKLIHYLLEHKHVSPFYHPQIQFRVKAPISVQRQWFKHKVGTAENSESTRYIEVHEEFYLPKTFHKQSGNKKQGSGEPLSDEVPLCRDEADVTYSPTGRHSPQQYARTIFETGCRNQFDRYKNLVKIGMAKEEARDLLPLCTYTSWVWTASLAAVLHFLELRDEDHAQWTIRQYAKAIRNLVAPHFPVTLRAFEKKTYSVQHTLGS